MNAFAPNRSDFNIAVQDRLAADSFDRAKAEGNFDDLDRRFNLLVAEQEGIELAIGFAANGEHPDAAPSFLARADPFRELVKKTPRKAAARLEELAEQIDDLRPKYMLARHQRQIAREEKAQQLAISFRPRQQKAVEAISQALEILSSAIAAEQDLHGEFQAQMPGLDALPDFGGQFRGMLLMDPRSAASMWIKAAKSMGYLK
jgi:hypothetical protein